MGTMLFLLTGQLPAQDVTFSQYLENLIFVNPAFAGVTGNMEVYTAYRQERAGQSAQFETYSIAYFQPSELLHGGFGFSGFRDNATGGFLSKSSLSAIYSYFLRLSRSWNVSAGFQATLVQKHLSVNGLILPEMIDPVRGAVLPASQTITPVNRLYFDYQVGFLFYHPRWYAGIAAYHLLEPQESNVKIPETILKRRFNVTAGHFMRVKTSVSAIDEIHLNFWTAWNNQRKYSQLLSGVKAYTRNLGVGLAWQGGWGKQYQYLIPTVAFATKKIWFSYSYNVHLGKTSYGMQRYVHEWSVKYSIDMQKQLSVPFTINPVGY